MTSTASIPSPSSDKSLKSYGSRFISSRTIRLGYVQLTDAAPFILADQLGMFARFGLQVNLERELGWATVREKILYGGLDVAQALGPMPFAASLGLGMSRRTECIAPLILNINGNGLTLGNHLRAEGVEKESDLRYVAQQRPASHPLTFGVVSHYSSHAILLRRWLKSQDLSLGTKVRMVVIPPAQMARHLRSGNLDGYLVGEPWNGAAVTEGTGWVAATSASIAPGHPEKVLMVRHDYAKNHSEEVIRLVAALLETCALCDDPGERRKMASHLASRKHLDCPETWLYHGLGIDLPKTAPRADLPLNTTQFFGVKVNEPSIKHGRWILKGMQETGLLEGVDSSHDTLIDNVFAPELFSAARRMRAASLT
ncbi:MAG: ABC transporter substrate-binding protein [Opitutales bacterium]|nr:ABC transporter substrate-binding protein [Opitutales bacterium]